VLTLGIGGFVLAVERGTFTYSRASMLTVVEAENSSLSGPVVLVSDSEASGGSYLEFVSSNDNTNGQTADNFQPSAPYYATFYYMWYKNPSTDGGYSYWSDHGNNPPNSWFSHYLPDVVPGSFDPSRELYSTNDYETFKWQAGELRKAKQEVAIASWWGQGTKEDAALGRILNDFMARADNPYPRLRWAIYYEDEGFENPDLGKLVSDLGHIKSAFTNSPYYLRVDGKPVIFVYAGADDEPGSMTQRWYEANAQMNGEFYVVLKVFPGYTNDTYQPDSWHQYAPAARAGRHGPYSSYVSPGFWLDDGSVPRLARDLNSFDAAVAKMVADNVTWKLVETWNEWGEGTSVEPGHQVRTNSQGAEEIDPNGVPFGELYVNVLNKYLPELETGVN